jgi:hypothetical protein
MFQVESTPNSGQTNTGAASLATIYHYSGTAKMGPPDDPEAVVNHELKGLRSRQNIV